MEGTIGEIRMFAGNFAPRNWAFCNNQLLAISSNTALFSILGTTYGGNGTTNFALPSLGGRVPVGVGQGNGLPDMQLGEEIGTPTVTLAVNNMPAHIHAVTGTASLPCKSGAGDADSPTGNIPAGSATDENYAAPAGGNGTMASANISGNTAVTGGSQPFSIMQPYLGMNYIICMFGVFPARN